MANDNEDIVQKRIGAAQHLGLDIGQFLELQNLLKGIDPAVLPDLFQLLQDLKALQETPEGQKILADIQKLLADFKTKQ